MRIIGLTGPIAAGKDVVAKILKRRGALIIDADKAAHELYASQSPVWHSLIKAFGSRILMRGGKIDRKKLGEIVFADQKKLQLLSKLVHPALKESIVSRLSSLVPRPSLVVINAALLKEIGLIEVVDEVWAVIASRETRLKRLLKSGLPRAAALRRLNSQLSQTEYVKMADVVIKNDGTLRQLTAQIKQEIAS
jgi:dephospho-CoA kinase